MDSQDFLKLYSKLAHNQLSNGELQRAFTELSPLVSDLSIGARFQSAANRVDEIICLDAVAHWIHQEPTRITLLWPGADPIMAKSVLDKLAGYEAENDVRKFNRGYATDILMKGPLEILKSKLTGKHRLGTRKSIKAAEERLVKKWIALPNELTLAEKTLLKRLGHQIELPPGKEALVVGGPCSVEMIDKEGHLITIKALQTAFEKFMRNPSFSNIMMLHSDMQVAQALPFWITEDGAIYESGVKDNYLYLISALRDDEDMSLISKVRDQINDGSIKSYSIAGIALNKELKSKSGKVFYQIDGLDLGEVSFCADPVNPGSTFEILKSTGGGMSHSSYHNESKESHGGPSSELLETLDRVSKSADLLLKEQATPPRPGLVFDRNRHRWVRPEGGESQSPRGTEQPDPESLYNPAQVSAIVDKVQSISDRMGASGFSNAKNFTDGALGKIKEGNMYGALDELNDAIKQMRSSEKAEVDFGRGDRASLDDWKDTLRQLTDLKDKLQYMSDSADSNPTNAKINYKPGKASPYHASRSDKLDIDYPQGLLPPNLEDLISRLDSRDNREVGRLATKERDKGDFKEGVIEAVKRAIYERNRISSSSSTMSPKDARIDRILHVTDSSGKKTPRKWN